jgi:hypothetical protein
MAVGSGSIKKAPAEESHESLLFVGFGWRR